MDNPNLLKIRYKKNTQHFGIWHYIVVLLIGFLIGTLISFESDAEEIRIINNYSNKAAEQKEFVPLDNVPLENAIQEYLYRKCEEKGIDYAFALAVIENESHFKVRPKDHKNSNGTTDRGLMQINSVNIKKFKKLGYISCAEDLHDPKKNIDCGLYLLGIGVSEYGNCEMAYTYYNSGKKNIRHTPTSRDVMSYWEKWRDVLDSEKRAGEKK